MIEDLYMSRCTIKKSMYNMEANIQHVNGITKIIIFSDSGVLAKIRPLLILNKWKSDCCFMPNDQFFSDIMSILYEKWIANYTTNHDKTNYNSPSIVAVVIVL